MELLIAIVILAGLAFVAYKYRVEIKDWIDRLGD